MADEIVGTGAVVIEIDDSAANRSVARFADQLERTLDRASAQAGAKVRRNIDRALAGLGDVSVSVNVVPDTTGFEAQLETLNPVIEASVRLNADPANTAIERIKDKLKTGLDRASAQAAASITRNLGQALRRFSPATVKVEADVTAFQAALDAARAQTGSVTLDIEPNANPARFRRAAQASLPPDGVKLKIVPDIREFVSVTRSLRVPDLVATVGLDVSRADAAIDRLSAKIERDIGRATGRAARSFVVQINEATREVGPATVNVEADVTRFQASLRRLQNIGETTIKVQPDINRTEFRRAVQAAVEGLEVKVRVVPDVSGFDRAVREITTPTIRARVETDVDNDRLQRSFAAIGTAATRSLSVLAGFTKASLAIGAVGIAAASATQSIIGLSAALAPAVGILAAAPATILGFVAAIGALKLALSGVGDAFKAGLSGDTKKFDEALKSLSPSAQSVAREVQAIKPAFDVLRKSVQEALFAPLVGQLTAVAAVMGGPLQRGLSGITAEFGAAGKKIGEFAQSKTAINAISDVLASTKVALGGVTTAITPLLTGFLQIGEAVSNAFGARLGAAIGDIGTRFGDFLSKAATGGQAVAWVDGAITVFGQLGSILSNLGGLIGGVFSAANASGGGFLNNLVLITGQMASFANSATGSEAIANVFRTISTIAAQLGPILTALVTQIGAIAPALTPLFTAIGPAIVSVINAIGPALQSILPGVQQVVTGLAGALAQIADSGALAALGSALGEVGKAIAPLLPIVGQLVGVIGNALFPVIGDLAKALAPVISALASSLGPVVTALAGTFANLVAALAPVVTIIGTTLASVITALAPVITVLANAFGTVLAAIAPLVAQLVSGLSPILSAIAPLITTLVTALTPLVTALVSALLPVLPPLIDAFLAVVNAVLPLLPVVGQLVEAIAPLVKILIEAAAPIIAFAAEIIKWEAINIVVPIIESVINIVLKIIEAVTSVIAAVTDFVSKVVSFFTDLASRVSSSVSGLVSSVLNFFLGLRDKALSAVSGLVGSVVTFFVELPGKILNALSSLASTLLNVFADAGNATINAIKNFVSDAVKFVTELPGKVKSGLGDLGSFLVSAGSDLIRGMINGVKNAASGLVSAAKDVVGSAISAAKSVLGINSPSRVFRTIGEQTGQGLIDGLEAMTRKVSEASSGMADAAVEPFDRLSVAGPNANGGSGSALAPITQPFGTQPGSDLQTTRSTRQTGGQALSQARTAGGITNNFTINQVTDADTTAERVVNRMVAAAGVYL